MARATTKAPKTDRWAAILAAPTHTVTHVTGRRVTCSCGWATAGNVESQDAARMIGEDHVRKAATR